MSRTPIEIVRDYVNGRQDNTIFCPHKEEDALTTALASVLRDAERFAALERAHLKRIDHGEGTMATIVGWGEYMADLSVWDGYPFEEPLAELADRLREGAA